MALPKSIEALGKGTSPEDWLRYFEELIMRKAEGKQEPSWERIFATLVMMGVEDPILDKEDESWTEAFSTENKRRVYNRRVWNALWRHPMAAVYLRRIAIKDLEGPIMSFGTDENDQYGKLAHKSYTSQLIEHFLVVDPSWI